jgi:hypothetical protein
MTGARSTACPLNPVQFCRTALPALWSYSREHRLWPQGQADWTALERLGAVDTSEAKMALPRKDLPEHDDSAFEDFEGASGLVAAEVTVDSRAGLPQ